MKKTLIIILLLLAALLLLFMWRHGAGWMPHMSGASHMMGSPSQGPSSRADIVLPKQFSEQAQKGKKLFETNCVSCHGQNAAGQTGKGPPLIHKIYEPSHHADESFQRAVALGVQAHHWPFGNMSRISGLSRNDVENIIYFVREVQRANGIE